MGGKQRLARYASSGALGRKPDLARSSQSAVTGNKNRLLVDQYRVRKPELPERGAQLLDLFPGMGLRIAWIRAKLADRPVNDRKRASG